jgi:hypothetical protein
MMLAIDQYAKAALDNREFFLNKPHSVGGKAFLRGNGYELFGRLLAPDLHFRNMPLYYFKLVDSHLVSDYGIHELADDTAAQIEALKLAQSLRETRPHLVGKHYSISVTNESGAGICVIPIESI